MNIIEICKAYDTLLEKIHKYARYKVKRKNENYFASFYDFHVGSFFVTFEFKVFKYDKYLDHDENHPEVGYLYIFLNHNNIITSDVTFYDEC